MSAGGPGKITHQNGFMPRLVGRLSAVPTENGLMIYSGSRRLVFRAGGTTPASVIQQILPMLDGSRDRAGICAESGVGHRYLEQALDLFEQAGILEWDHEDDTSGFPDADVRDYVSGFLVKPSGYESSHEVRQVLASTAIILACMPEITAAASADLRRIGLGSVVAAGTADDTAKATAAMRKVFANGVVVCGEDCGDSARFDRELNELTRESWPILRYHMCPCRVEIGPLFTAGYPCCVACFRSAQADSGASLDRTDLLDGALLQDPNFAASLLVNRLVSLLIGDGSVSSWSRTVWTLTAEDVVSSTRFAVVPDVRCVECGWGVGDATGGGHVQVAAQRALTSECLAESWNAIRIGQAGHARGPVTAQLTPSREAKDPAPRHRGYLPAEVLDRTRLAAEYEDEPGSRSSEQRLIAAVLSAAGDALEQFAAHAEKNVMGPQQGGWIIPYLLVPSDIFEIPGSIFKYEYQASQIISVNSERQSLACYRDAICPRDDELCRGSDRRTPKRCLAIIFVGGGSSLEWENSVAWRLAHLRTGYVLDSLANFTQSTGVAFFARAVVSQSALAQMLELRPDREVITAAVEISLDAGGPECH